jgi:hypothetical protein
LDRGHDAVEGERRRGHAISALLLALSAIVGLVAAYMFSATTGDHCLNTAVSFDFPSALLAIAALLMVSGISVAAASQPQLGQTAAALRLVLVLAAILVCVRLYFDYERATAISHRYGDFVEAVKTMPAWTDTASADDGLAAGATAALDQQLDAFARTRWEDAVRAERPALLANYLFGAQASDSTRYGMQIVAAGAIALAAFVGWNMRKIVGHGFPGEAEVERAFAEPSPWELAEEAWWRRWTSWVTVGTIVLVAGAFSSVANTGDELASPPAWLWVGLFALVTSVAAFVAQPPRVGLQRPVWLQLPVWRRRRPRLRRASRSSMSQR